MRSDSVGASGPFKVFGTVGSIATFHVTSSSNQQCFFRLSCGVQSLLSQVHGATSVLFVHHTGARNSRNRFRMASTGEELFKYPADDPRGAPAVSKLGVVGPELDGNSSGSPTTIGADKSCINITSSFNRRVSFGVHPERMCHNVQRHTAITFRRVAANWSCSPTCSLV